MKELNSFSPVGIFIANALTAILVLGMWLATNNIWITVGTLILLPFAMMKLVNRNVTVSYKIILVVLVAILFGIFAYFFRVKYEDPKTISNGDEAVLVEENKKGDEKDKDDTPKVEDQEVIVSKNGWNGVGRGSRKSPTITPTYFNTGGSSKRDGSVNTGASKAANEGPVKIVVEDDNSQELKDKIAEELADGRERHDLNDGVIGFVGDLKDDDKKQDEDKTGHDTNNEPDLETENKIIEKLQPNVEPEKKPEVLPKTEQLKKDLTDMSQDEMDKLANDVKPTVDNTTSETTQKDKSSDNKLEESTSSTDAPKNDDGKGTSQEASNTNQDTKPAESSTEDTPTVVSEPEVVVTPAQPEYTPVSIQSLDGSTAVAGDTVQFKVTGDVKSVEGLDGLSYSNSNGYISVETKANESTLLTPVVTGQDGSTASTTVAVSVLNGQ